MSKNSRVVHVNCQNCGINQLCLPYTLDDQSLNRLDSMIERKRPYQKGDVLFREDDPLISLYAVRSGSVKSYTINDGGEMQITAFHLPGDLIGFSSISEDKHQSYAEALETSMLCEIPFSNLEQLSAQVPVLRRQILRLMSEEMNSDKRMITLVTSRTAEERVATFLLDLASRFHKRGLSPSEFRLSMTRAEIGNYLGLTVETVSRLFGRFQKEQWIQSEGRFVTLLDIHALSTLAGCSPFICQT